MKVSSLATFALGIVTLSASIAACSTTNNNAVQHTSAAGQSCLTTGDCMGSDVCVSNVCTAGAAPAGDGGGSSSGTGTSSGGSSGAGTSSGGSSGAGTSSGGSTSSSGGTAVEAAPPHLGARGDACQSTTECAAGLSCIPVTGTFASGGICDLTTYGLTGTTTGGTCSGECKTAMDCCELPVNVVIGATTYHNCNDIQNQVIGGSPTSVCAGLTAGDTSATGLGCFYFNAYCNGCSGAWTCDTNNLCQYSGNCGASGLSYKGCAAKSRTGRTTGFVPTCNSAGHCAATVTATGCIMDTDCAGGAYVPFDGTYATNNNCRAPTSSGGSTDCTCYQHQCYLACASDLDCATGYKCDSGTKLCTPTGACGSAAQCAASLGDITAQCTNGTCSIPCTTDQQCGPSGINPGKLGSFGGRVCVSGTCKTLGCTGDSDCNIAGGAGAVHFFCETPAAGAATATYASAITN